MQLVAPHSLRLRRFILIPLQFRYAPRLPGYASACAPGSRRPVTAASASCHRRRFGKAFHPSGIKPLRFLFRSLLRFAPAIDLHGLWRPARTPWFLALGKIVMTTIPKTSNPLRVVLSRIGEPSLAHYGAARTPLNTPQEAASFWKDIVSPEASFEAEKEHLVAVLVDTKLRPTGYHVVSVGSLNEAIAHPREIMRAAVVASAYGIILMHNHPSGDSAPSEADRRVTLKVRDAADLLQIRFLDHVVVGDGNHYSFREGGLI